MPDLFHHLPFEVICVIFTLLDQPSCLESMKVCHDWFNRVPRHSTTLWRQVNFYDIWTKSNPCLLRCLGIHVREVIISYRSLNTLMTILKIRCQSTVSSLIIQCGNSNRIISSTDTSSSSSSSNSNSRSNTRKNDDINSAATTPKTSVLIDNFFQGLEKGKNQLTRLSISDLSYDISLLKIARTCPHLTYLSISLDKSYEARQQRQMPIITTTGEGEEDEGEPNTTLNNSNIEREADPHHSLLEPIQPLLPKLIHLQLDTSYDFNTKIIPFLHQCPFLRRIEFSPFIDLELHIIRTPADHNDIDFCRILELCPWIESLECNFMNYPENTMDGDDLLSGWISHHSLAMLPDTKKATTRRATIHEKEGTKTSSTLHAFKFANDLMDRSNRVIGVLEKESSTLESLCLKQAIPGSELGGGNGWEKMRDIKLPHLEDLAIIGNMVNKKYLVPFLSHHTDTLTHLSLTEQLASSSEIMQVVSQMQHLKRIAVCMTGVNRSFRILPLRRRQQQQTSSQEQPQQQSQQLQRSNRYSCPHRTSQSSRQLHRTRSFLGPFFPSLPDNICLLENISSLQEIDMRGIHLSDAALDIFGHMHSLQSLTLVDAPTEPRAVTSEGLLGFVTLKTHQGTLSSLQHLTLSYFVSLDDNVMAALGEIHTLRSLCISICNSVTDSGLRQFIDGITARNGTNNSRPDVIHGNDQHPFSSLSVYQCRKITEDGLQYAYDKLGIFKVTYWKHYMNYKSL